MTAQDYQMPYYDVVNPDPTIEEMKIVVCHKKVRPQCPDTWDTIEVSKDDIYEILILGLEKKPIPDLSINQIFFVFSRWKF